MYFTGKPSLAKDIANSFKPEGPCDVCASLEEAHVCQTEEGLTSIHQTQMNSSGQGDISNFVSYTAPRFQLLFQVGPWSWGFTKPPSVRAACLGSESFLKWKNGLVAGVSQGVCA